MARATASTPARLIDLDAARKERAAARSEADREPVVLRFGGKEFKLPVEMPLEYTERGSRGDVRGAIEALLGDDAASFFGLGVSVEDFKALTEIANDVYGVGEGKPPASTSS